MSQSSTGKLAAFMACAILIVIMGVFGYIYARNRLDDNELQISFYTLKGVETTANVGNRGYYVDLDVAFISGDEKATNRLEDLEQRLRDIVVESLGRSRGDIRTPEGKKSSQRTILKKVRELAPEIYDVAFSNFLMVPLFGVNGDGLRTERRE